MIGNNYFICNNIMNNRIDIMICGNDGRFMRPMTKPQNDISG